MSSNRADATRVAALQAEFNEKRWVWVPDAREGYLAGWVSEEGEDSAQVVMANGGEVCQFPASMDRPDLVIDPDSPFRILIQDESPQV